MIKQLLIVVGAAASTAAVVAAVTWPGVAQQRTAQQAAYVLEKTVAPLFDRNYTAGMRIIHVPQAGIAAPQARVAPSYREDADVREDEVEAAPKPRKPVMPQPRRVLPSSGEPKRTMLNAPKALHDGPSPVRPLPRWREIEKFTELPQPATSAPIPAAPAAIDDDALPPAN